MRRVLLLWVLSLLFGPVLAAAQISPGPLSAAHADLEGVTNCTKCHPLGGKSMNDGCLTCHLEVGWLREKNLGLHGKSRGDDCSSCHPEHAGRDFQLVDWGEGGRDGFDHLRVGWALAGAHAKASCPACHQPRHHRSPVGALLKGKQKETSFLGLDRSCRSCHAVSHDGKLGAQCLDCHTMEGFKPASGFQHTTFALAGRHAQIDCAKCHSQLASDGRSRTYRPLEHAQCSSCHTDPHQTRFGAQCSKCHTESGWKVVRDGAFDHQRTRFALRGAHVQVACDKCHQGGSRRWPAGKPFGQCADCHATPHGTQLSASCETCHAVAAWKPSTYGLTEHAKSRFALAGAHAKAACVACHGAERPSRRTLGAEVVGRVGWAFSLDAGCLDCHYDPHGIEPAADCTAACHSMESWVPARIGVAEHARFDWPLEGAHAATPCFACHPSFVETAGAALRSLDPPPAHPLSTSQRECSDCHQDPHAGQFAPSRCDTCHDTAAFQPASRFDHARVRAIKLTGGHGKLACAACHPRVDGVVRYRLGTTSCQSCHRQGVVEGKMP